jgi:hypothetical protein
MNGKRDIKSVQIRFTEFPLLNVPGYQYRALA